MNEINLWKMNLLAENSLIKDAVKILSESAIKIVLVIDSNFRLCGTITDGDVRRGLIRGLDLSNMISEIVNREPIVVNKEFGRARIENIMLTNKIREIPIVDHESKLVGLHLWEESRARSYHENVIVIMAGGKGTRLLPKTEHTPKPMLRLGEKPILEHIIRRAKEEGFTRFILAIHHLGEVIENYFGDGEAHGVEISYIREKTPLGTAGALGYLSDEVKGSVIVTNGDLITDISFASILDFHNQNNAMATMAVQRQMIQKPYGVVSTAGIHIIGFHEKPIEEFFINAGIYVFHPDCLDLIKEGDECNMPELFYRIISKGFDSVAYVAHEKWSDIGEHNEFSKIEREMGLRNQNQVGER